MIVVRVMLETEDSCG